MTTKREKLQIEVAAFAVNAYYRADALADRLDPKRLNDSDEARTLTGICGTMRGLLWCATGLAPNEIAGADCNTESPSPHLLAAVRRRIAEGT